MRIIAGKYRRRKLLANPGLSTRPITDRVKEYLFERLHGELPDRSVADLFAGTGTIGLESLSRGARSVVFIENDHRAHELLKRNVATLGVEDQTLCWRTDVLSSSFRPKGLEQVVPYDIIFCDPPYRMIPALVPGSPFYRALQRLARDTVSTASSQLVLRTPKRASFECPPVWERHEMLEISRMELHLYRKPGSHECQDHE